MSVLSLRPGVDVWNSVGTIRRHRPRALLVHQGEPLEAVHRFVEGTAKVVVDLEHGRELTLAVLRAGDWYGAAEVLADVEEAPASIVAMGEVVTHRIPVAQFRGLSDRHPEATYAVAGLMASRLVECDRRRVADASLSVPRRLATLLLELGETSHCDADTAEVSLSQTELASLMGTSRDTTTRALRHLRVLGLVKTRRRLIDVVSIAGLRGYAARGLREFQPG